jgi:surfactin family lipopeptide synthetase A
MKNFCKHDRDSKQLTGADLEMQITYWQAQLADAPPMLALPTDRPRSIASTFQLAQKSTALAAPLMASLEGLSVDAGCSLATTFLAAFKTLLQRYSGQEDILVGMPIVTNTTEFDRCSCSNTLILRTQVAGNLTFRQLLDRVNQTKLAAEQHQDLPIEMLEALHLEPSLGHTPLSQVMFEWGDLPKVSAEFELLLSIVETGLGWESVWSYNQELFDATTIDRLAGHFQILLAGCVANPERKLDRLPLLSAAEREQLLLDWNDTQTRSPLDLCFAQLFEAQVLKTPDAIAAVYEERQLTYQQLNDRANRWAHQLVERGVAAETLVALLGDRNIDFLTAILAVFKAGGAYLPLNPQHPIDRIHQVLEQSQSPLILCASSYQTLADNSRQLLVLEDLDTVESSSDNLPVRCTPDNLAYVIFTSGSTGKPKGAMLEQRGMLNHLYAKVTDLQLIATDRVAQTASQTFDISIWQFLVALLVGGSVEIVPQETVADPALLVALVERQQVSILEIVPSLLRMILSNLNAQTPQTLDSLRWLILTGEALPPQLCRQWFEICPQIPMMNAYGPTECSDDVTHYALTSAPAADVVNLPIGRPIANTQLYIFNALLQPVPIGVAGELYVGGVGVGRGYLNNPELTQLAFIAHPFAESGRLYKTGDKARYLPDGNIEYLDRIDYQVKVRGFRIELGEIESVLAQHPQVREAVAIVREDRPGDRRLVAYVVSGTHPEASHPVATRHPSEEGIYACGGSEDGNLSACSVQELRDFLKRKLPEYMVPAAVVMLEAIPLTPNGKVDRKALPVPDLQIGSDYVPPSTPTQVAVAGIWAEVLQVRVGIHDNFFELGGNSLLATQVVSRSRAQFSLDLPLRQLFASPTVAELSEWIDTSDPLELQPSTAIVPIDRAEFLPLSFAQARLWFFSQLEGESAAYNMPEPLRLVGELNVGALERAIAEIVRRHEVLRTSFHLIDEAPVQQITTGKFTLPPTIDLQSSIESAQSQRLQELALAEARRPFDLAQAPLFRVTLIRLSDRSHVLLLTMHHIISDGWSMDILVRELAALYQSYCANQPSTLPELPIQYADFASWQRKWLRDGVLDRQLAYWKQQLSGAPSLLELPTDRPRPAIQTFNGKTASLEIDRELTQQLKSIGQKSGATLYMTLLAAFSTLLYRYSGQEDLVVGSPIANRNHREIESLIGFFVNTLVMRTQFGGDPTFVELLDRVRDNTLDAQEHQDLPFEKLVEELHPERSLSYTPLFQVMFVLQNPAVSLVLPDLTITPFVVEDVNAKFDLTLSVTETEAGLRAEFIYNTDLFDADRIDRMTGHFQILLSGIVTNPQARVAQLPLLTGMELEQLLYEWNDTETEYPQDKCIHELFVAQVERTPDAIAVVFEAQRLTYRELNDRANQLAHYLQTLGVKPEVMVGICVERSVEMIVGLLGILKAGGAYVPLDPAYPQDRIGYMLEDSQVSVLLTQQRLQADLPAHPQVICLDTDWAKIANQPATEVHSGVQANNLAYVIYTSGSTGKPKGVLVQHQGLCNLALAQIQVFDVHADSRVLQFASFSFDASISEVVMTLCIGASLHLAQRDDLMPGVGLLNLLQTQGITHVTLSPSALAAMPKVEIPSLRTIVVAGEACPPDLANQWSSGRRFINGYGPTEATVCATTAICNDSNSPLPIGRPIANTQLYILDRNLQPVPIGIPGELHIGGAGLARGYLNRADLTAAKFIPNPFGQAYSGRLYKTGDLTRYRSDGNIDFLGRIDQQVKIRGFRIELEEIEALLSQHPRVREVAVIAKEDTVGKRLVAYLVLFEGMTHPEASHPVATRHPSQEGSSSDCSVQELRGFLKEKLPDFMIPSAFVMLDAMPLTPNGKIDRKALAKIDPDHSELENTFVAPSNPVEEVLAGIWAEILGLEQVGIHHNFFELGGHSLLATQVISRIQDAMDVTLPLRTLFERQTIAELSVAIVQNMVAETDDDEMERLLAELELAEA